MAIEAPRQAPRQAPRLMAAGAGCTEFGPFRLFPGERRLLRGDAPVAIGSRALDILIALVERPGEVVGKRELFARVWPDMMVEESSLRVHVAGLRKALAEGDAQGRYIVNVPGRGYSFVAARAAAAPSWAGAPPRRPPRLIGREADLAAVAGLVAAHRFATIHGSGGVGKTTLGLALAEAQAPMFEGGVCFVDLSLNVGVHSVAEAVAAALELVVGSSDPTANILDFLRGRELLLVLDSCETNVDAAAALAEAVVQQAPGVAILATSREPLRALSEHVYPLEPLGFPPEGAAAAPSDMFAFPAAQLFCERAVAGGYRAGFGDADAAVVGEICRRVDGNALALELAASRVSTYGLRQTADLLDSHMKLAWRGRRTAPARHQTLAAMLDWSYALIAERERDVFRQLSVFVGGFGLDEARGVAGDGAEVLDALEQLVLKSLVAVDTGGHAPRYRLLDMARAYAGVKLLESGTVGEVRRRHALYYLDWLTRSTDVAAAPVEHTANIRAALEWAFSIEGDVEAGLGLATYACELFLRLGMLAESRRWSERALASLPAGRAGSLQEMTLQAARGHAAMVATGDSGFAREALERALRIAEDQDDPWHQFRLLGSMHSYHRRIGGVDELYPIAEQAVRIAPRLGGTAPIVAAQGMLGLTHHLKGDLAAAHRELAAVSGARLGAGEVNNFYGFHRAAEVLLARTLWLMGFPDSAQRIEREANAPDAYGDPITECLGLIWGISVQWLCGNWATAEADAERLLAIAGEQGYLPYKWFATAIRGELRHRQGDAGAGLEGLEDYLRRLRDGRYEIYTPWLTCCLAEGLAGAGQAARALALLDELDPEPAPRAAVHVPEFLRVRGVVLAGAGRRAAAEQSFQAALAMAQAQGALSWRLRTLTSAARLDPETWRRPLAETYARFTEGFGTRDLAAAQALLAGEGAPG